MHATYCYVVKFIHAFLFLMPYYLNLPTYNSGSQTIVNTNNRKQLTILLSFINDNQKPEASTSLHYHAVARAYCQEDKASTKGKEQTLQTKSGRRQQKCLRQNRKSCENEITRYFIPSNQQMSFTLQTATKESHGPRMILIG